jgi:hypothetical protein
MKRWTMIGLVMLVLGALVIVALPALGAADDSNCFVDAAGQIVCQDAGTGGGDANTCTTDPDDGSGLPECGTPKDNECYPGGVMAGKCDSEWHWKGGWWLARLNHYGLSRADFPAEFVSLLPPLPEPTEVGGGPGGPVGPSLPGGCFNHASFNDTQFIGPPNTVGNTQDWNSFDGTCTGGILVTYTSVFAANGPEAVSMCAALGAPIGSVEEYVMNGYTTSNTGAAMPAGLYWCF